MAIHQRILEVVLHLCQERGGWTFRPGAVVSALPDLNAGSVRTHVMSRCCVNAPSHHAHRWPYFRRLRRGLYEVLPAWRSGQRVARLPGGVGTRAAGASREPAAIVVEVRESGAGYTAVIPTIPARIRAASLDDLVSGARRAALKARTAGPDRSAPLRFVIDLAPDPDDPVVAAYEKGIDRTLIRRNLRMGPEERLRALERWANATERIRGAASRPRRRPAR